VTLGGLSRDQARGRLGEQHWRPLHHQIIPLLTQRRLRRDAPERLAPACFFTRLRANTWTATACIGYDNLKALSRESRLKNESDFKDAVFRFQRG
jgi:hypothetical protein